MASPTNATSSAGGQDIDFDQSLEEMRGVFQEAIRNNLEVNKLSTEGKTAIEAARNRPLG